jgi:hypothetical protein
VPSPPWAGHRRAGNWKCVEISKKNIFQYKKIRKILIYLLFSKKNICTYVHETGNGVELRQQIAALQLSVSCNFFQDIFRFLNYKKKIIFFSLNCHHFIFCYHFFFCAKLS